VSIRTLHALILVLLGACATTTPGPIVVSDSHIGCEGGGPTLDYEWTRDGDWFVRGSQRVPSGVVTRLRELALAAPEVKDAPLPRSLQFSEETIFRRSGAIEEAASRWSPWLADSFPPEISAERFAQVVRGQLIDPGTSTDWSLLHITLPGTPRITIHTRSRRPYAQPWVVTVGEAESRTVLSLEMSRYAALIVDPVGPNFAELQGASYWAYGFWSDESLWSRVLGDPWNEQYSREVCTQLKGWADVEKEWTHEDADIGHINMHPLSLQVDLASKTDALVGFVRWWNRFLDNKPRFGWSSFQFVHKRATEAAARLPFLKRWKEAGPNRVISLDAIALRGEAMDKWQREAWAKGGLQGDTNFVFKLRIDGNVVATLIVGPDADGAVVMDEAHESLPKPDKNGVISR